MGSHDWPPLVTCATLVTWRFLPRCQTHPDEDLVMAGSAVGSHDTWVGWVTPSLARCPDA